jgi:hypothetical protein
MAALQCKFCRAWRRHSTAVASVLSLCEMNQFSSEMEQHTWEQWNMIMVLELRLLIVLLLQALRMMMTRV